MSRVFSSSRVRWTLCVLLAVYILHPSSFILSATPAIELRDGTSVQALSLRRDGGTVVATIETSPGRRGEIGYPVTNIVRIDFPEPGLLKLTQDQLAEGLPEETLRQLAQAVAYYQPFLDVPGNWWKGLIRLQIDALTALHRDRDLDAVAASLARSAGSDPGLARFNKFRQAATLLRQNNPQKVLDLLGPVVLDETATADDLAEGWLELGSAHLIRREYDDALLAYLHIPVYTPGRKALAPTALLGSARAYIGIDDRVHAKDALDNLVANYPTAPEVPEAKELLAKMAARARKPIGA